MADYIVRATAAGNQIRAFAATTKDTVEDARQAHNTCPFAIIHRTVQCAERKNGRQRNGRLQRSADTVNSARRVRGGARRRTEQ